MYVEETQYAQGFVKVKLDSVGWNVMGNVSQTEIFLHLIWLGRVCFELHGNIHWDLEMLTVTSLPPPPSHKKGIGINFEDFVPLADSFKSGSLWDRFQANVVSQNACNRQSLSIILRF